MVNNAATGKRALAFAVADDMQNKAKMLNMEDSIAHEAVPARALMVPAWKTILNAAAASILCFLFVISGVGKIVDPFGWATRLIEFRVPADFSIPLALIVGTVETLGAVLIIVPRFRRWGAWLIGGLLVGFMVYFGIHYSAFRGMDCSCFPPLNVFGYKIDFKRAVGPEFFVGDAAMLVLALVAGAWARASESFRSVAIIAASIAVFAVASFGLTYARQSGTKAPDTITVDGQPFSLQHGKVFIYFFDPECSHCYEAAQKMAKFTWRDVKRVGVPTSQPRFAQSFMKDTGMTAPISNDLDLLKKTFPFTAGPFAVALENGRLKEQFLNFEGDEPAESLKKLGWVE
jgi:uncharacterized membrane protein YphA (DoxX/SURF4 family)